MENPIQGRWFILLTEPQREGTATAGLVARGFAAFSPSLYTTVALKDREGRHLKDEHGRKQYKKIAKPMFQGYGFIKFADDGAEPYAAALKVPGVSGFLRSPGATADRHRYATLPAPLVDAIRREEEDQLSAFELARRNGTDKLKIPFFAGGSARIDGGPYDSWVGEMKTLSKAGRVRLLLDMLGGKVSVEVDGSQLTEASETEAA